MSGSLLWFVLDMVMRIGPPLVGLVLVLAIRTSQRWRTWALASFGLSVLAGAVWGAYVFAGFSGWAPFSRGPVASVWFLGQVMTLLSLVASCLGVAAVVSGRTSDAVPQAEVSDEVGASS